MEMTLSFDDRKLLPAGVLDASLEVVEELFSRFQHTDRRIRLFGKLRDYLAAVKKAECATSVIIDGSFVMGCVNEPEDIDLILVLPQGWDTKAELKPYQYNLVSKKRVKKEYGIEVFAVAPESVDEQEWIDFFCRVNVKWCEQFGWPIDTKKGIVKVVL
jgi:hypothetical protein